MYFWKMDLKEFIKLTDFLKSCIRGETVKKAKTFNYEEIKQLLNSPMIKNSNISMRKFDMPLLLSPYALVWILEQEYFKC